jgi:hypothetical protein
MQVNFKIPTVVLGVSALLFSAAACAQQYASPPQQPAAQSTAQSHLSARTLAKFKRAYDSVKAIEHKFSAAVRATHNTQDALKLREQAQTQMVTAVQSTGLTIPEFNDMMMLMQREPALRKKILGH